MSRPRRAAIPVHSRNNHVIQGREVSPGAMVKLVDSGEAQLTCIHCGRHSERSRCPHRPAHEFILQLTHLEIKEETSAAGISPSEMETNAFGAAGLLRRKTEKVLRDGDEVNEKTDFRDEATGELVRPGNFVDEAMSKVEQYFTVGMPRYRAFSNSF